MENFVEFFIFRFFLLSSLFVYLRLSGEFSFLILTYLVLTGDLTVRASAFILILQDSTLA